MKFEHKNMKKLLHLYPIPVDLFRSNRVYHESAIEKQLRAEWKYCEIWTGCVFDVFFRKKDNIRHPLNFNRYSITFKPSATMENQQASKVVGLSVHEEAGFVRVA